MNPGDRPARVPLRVAHIVREAERPSQKDGRPLPGQDYVTVSRGAFKKQLVCISKDEWPELRALIDGALS